MEEPANRAAVVVLGVGNPDRRDDGIGPRIVGTLQNRLPAGVDAAVAQRDVADILSLVEGRAGAVIVDAATGPDIAAGSVCVIDPDRTPLPPVPRDPSGHALGLAAALALGTVLGDRPDMVSVVVVGAADLGYGERLSAVVEGASGAVAEAVLSEAARMVAATGAGSVQALGNDQSAARARRITAARASS